ncbi:MAG TPA: sulfite reductase subunit beta (hemoprotein) [Spirochaetia bacterium]|nr:MAG: hypothetical protein A2Y41_04305 [Spirochaetes bacterium GWB1_36_13]HCL57138.1 sulfite reductase subunit beta (hemoprotein) [Spirochaetia bacterium]
MKGYKLPENLESEINELEKMIDGFLKGAVDPLSLKVFRVPFGIYEQRKTGTYMVRIRCAAGFITPFQLKKTAELSKEFGKNTLHLTTRQEIQIHDVDLKDIVFILRELKKTGLSSRGGGGNTVRNITASPESGIDPEEVFDVAPYAYSLTTRFLAEEDSWKLPRKYKIAFSHNEKDTSFASVTDLGFIAEIKDGQKGFQTYIAGGMGAKSEPGNRIYDFLPEKDVYYISRALKNIFNQYGNRKNRSKARIRFLYEKLGEKEFKRLLEDEMEKLKKTEMPLKISFDPSIEIKRERINNPQKYDVNSFEIWKKRFVKKQNNSLYSIVVPVFLGDISNQKVLELSDLLSYFGEDTIRLTHNQNILLRNIPEESLSEVFSFLDEKIEDSRLPSFYGNIVSCAGASTCQLGICFSQDAARAVRKKLLKINLDLEPVKDIRFHISGCPNSCGQHLIGDIGFIGGAARKGEKVYPSYKIVLGAFLGEGRTRFGKIYGEVSARDLPRFVSDFFSCFIQEKKENEKIYGWMERGGEIWVSEKLKEDYSDIPDFDEDKNYYYDWGSEEIFTIFKRGKGECSAGLFDFIERDEKNIENVMKKLENEKDIEKRGVELYHLAYYSSRMLLITRGVEASTDKKVFEEFENYFMKTGLIPSGFEKIIRSAFNNDKKFLPEDEKKVFELAEEVKKLYQSMDDSLNFPLNENKDKKIIQSIAEEKQVNLFKDLRGVACPMNFVKTKMELSKMRNGEILEIWLDEGAPIENVPRSVTEEGHKILVQEKKEDCWKVVIQKGG